MSLRETEWVLVTTQVWPSPDQLLLTKMGLLDSQTSSPSEIPLPEAIPGVDNGDEYSGLGEEVRILAVQEYDPLAKTEY